MSTILSKAIADYFETKGIGTFGADIFAGKRPDSPIDCLTVYDTGGFPPKKDTTASPTIQVSARSKIYPDGLKMLHQVHEILKDDYNFWLIYDQIWVYYTQAQGEPGHVGRDNNGNHLFSTNYNLWLKYY